MDRFRSAASGGVLAQQSRSNTAFNALHGQRATVGKTWVNALRRQHAQALQAQRRTMRQRRPFAVDVGKAWSLDLSFVPAPGSPPRCVFGLIDQGSRAALRLRVIVRKCTWTLLGHLCLTIAQYGPPQAIRTDNESMFTSRLWACALKLAGIRHQRIAPKCPWQNGRIERFFGTLKPVLRQLALPTSAALQGALNEFVMFYNHARAHQGLGGLTPAQAWRGLTHRDTRRCAGQGCWVQAFDGLLIAYRLRC
jgi:putative transposase